LFSGGPQADDVSGGKRRTMFPITSSEDKKRATRGIGAPDPPAQQAVTIPNERQTETGQGQYCAVAGKRMQFPAFASGLGSGLMEEKRGSNGPKESKSAPA